MIVIQGGLISKEEGNTISYKVKCDKCGSVEPSESSVNITKGVTEVYNERCSACGNNQTIKMKHEVKTKV